MALLSPRVRRKVSRIHPVHWLLVLATVLLLYRAWKPKSEPELDVADAPDVDFVLQDQTQQQLLLHGQWTDDIDAEFLARLDKKTHKCANYVEYSQTAHAPYSQGRYKYPYMRPPPKCRTFTSPALERLVADLKRKIKDPDLARLVENALPNTLDTTILWHKPAGAAAGPSKYAHLPETFVVTGDIHAEWLRDSARQLSVFQPLIKHDPALRDLVRGAIRLQEQYVITSPYCNAFHPPAASGIKKGNTAMDNVYPRPNWKQVFECKYEIDSLASFLTLTNEYVEHSGGDLSVITPAWLNAFEKILIVLKRESQPLFSPATGHNNPFYYSFQRDTNIGSETLPLGGVGNPVNYNTGLVRSAFRPSDDATILQFFIPGNAHMVSELRKLVANVLDKIDPAQLDVEMHRNITAEFVASITEGINTHGIVHHPKWGKVFAYEVDGYGSNVFMDDANVPSLLSMPELGFVSVDDEVYQNTRKMILSKDGNPYYIKGTYFEGIGGPHIGIQNAWPMSLLVRMRTTLDDEEILASLRSVMATTAGLGLMHESVNVNRPKGMDYTRPWFAWCNSEFGKTILHLAKHKPHLIFKEEYASTPYDIDAVMARGGSV